MRIPMYLLAAQQVKTLRVKCVSQYSSFVYSVIIRLELRPALRCVLIPTSTKFIVATYNPAEECLTPFDGDVRLKKKISSQETCCITFSTFFINNKPHDGELMSEFIFALNAYGIR